MGAIPADARRLLVIENPAAGPRGRRRIEAVLAASRAEGSRLELARTARPGDAERWTREAATLPFDAIVVAGGDGTVNEVLNGLDLDRQVLGVIPAGTANVLARELGLPSDAPSLARLLARGPVRRAHLGEVNGRRFAMMAGVGFDARAVTGVSARLKRRAGRLAYGVAILEEIAHAGGPRLRVRAGAWSSAASWVVAAKGRHYAGGFVIAPMARLENPTLSLCVCPGGGRVNALRYLASLGVGLLPVWSDVRYRAATEVVVEGPPSEPVQADGEPVGRLPAAVRLGARTVRLIAPSAGATLGFSTAALRV
jgi:YegS/Rv2252/BmrU family lipid kinase